MPKKNLTLYLAKDDVANQCDILTPKAQLQLNRASTRTVVADGFGDGATLHVFVGNSSEPEWLIDLRSEFQIPGRIDTQSTCAVLIFRTEERLFAATFAHGWMYLNESNLETDFGLRVALNALDERKLKRLERANLADALRGVALSPFQREFREFGIDDALDLVRKISGSTRDTATADSLTGARSLKVTGNYVVTDLPTIASEALSFFVSTDYKNTSFRIIDVVTPVTDKRVIALLDEIATVNIRQGLANFELSLPVSYDDDDVGYRFKGPGLRGAFPDLLLRNYTAALGPRLADLRVKELKTHRIVAIYSNDAKPDQNSTIRSALVGSVVHEEGRYAINEGEWYRIDETFKESIELDYSQLLGAWDDPPRPFLKIFDDQNNGKYQIEAEYNRIVSENSDLILLDARFINIPGIQRSQFEACDLLDISNKRLIHVKKSSRRSSVLSHFFKQGANSAQNIAVFPAAMDGILRLVRESDGDEAFATLQATIGDNNVKWTVEFWIADAPRANGEFNIPFFSKISLRDEVRRMQAMSFNVVLKFIRLDPENI